MRKRDNLLLRGEGFFMQYDLFEKEEISCLRHEIETLHRSQSNMRRGLFARHNELQRLVNELQSQLKDIKQISANKKAELLPFFGEYIEVANENKLIAH